MLLSMAHDVAKYYEKILNLNLHTTQKSYILVGGPSYVSAGCSAY